MGLSYRILSPLEAGVKKHTITNTITDKLFSSGRHYVDPFHIFIIFPTTLQTIEFGRGINADAQPLRIPSEGGQIIEVELSFQYRLMTSQLTELYKQYETKYKTKYVSIAKGELQIVGAKFTMTEWYQNRIQIGQAMHSHINEIYQNNVSASVVHFQLRNIIPPKTINRNILQKVVQQEATNLERERKEAKKTRAQALTLVANYGKDERIVNATAKYEAKLITNNANAQAIKVTLKKKASAYRQLKDRMGFNNAEFLNFLYTDVLRTAKGTDRIISNMNGAFFSQSI